MQNRRKKLRTIEGLSISQEPPKCKYGNYEMFARGRYEDHCDKRWIEWRLTVTDSEILKMIQNLTNLKCISDNLRYSDIYRDIRQTASETHCRIMDMVMENRSFQEIKELYEKAVKNINENNYEVILSICNSPNSFTNTIVKLFPDFESVKAFIETKAKSIESFCSPEMFAYVGKIDFITGKEEFVCRTRWNPLKHKVVFEYERY